MASTRGDPNPESGNFNLRSGNPNPSEKEDQLGEEPTQMNVSMVFMILTEFCAPVEVKGIMKSLFIRGHLDGTSVGHMLVDEGVSVNILSLSLFKKLGHVEGELKCTNLSLSGFAGDPMEVKGIICKELTVGSKTVPTAFFVVDVKRRYNVLLGRDWIHANGCVPSTLHQCVIQWIGDEV
jgi:hypothetical protein